MKLFFLSPLFFFSRSWHISHTHEMLWRNIMLPALPFFLPQPKSCFIFLYRCCWMMNRRKKKHKNDVEHGAARDHASVTVFDKIFYMLLLL